MTVGTAVTGSKAYRQKRIANQRVDQRGLAALELTDAGNIETALGDPVGKILCFFGDSTRSQFLCKLSQAKESRRAVNIARPSRKRRAETLRLRANFGRGIVFAVGHVFKIPLSAFSCFQRMGRIADHGLVPLPHLAGSGCPISAAPFAADVGYNEPQSIQRRSALN